MSSAPQDPRAASRQDTDEVTMQSESTNAINLSLLDPPRYGWTATGGIADVLSPHERARRNSAKKSFLRSKRKRDAAAASSDTNAAARSVRPKVAPPTTHKHPNNGEKTNINHTQAGLTSSTLSVAPICPNHSDSLQRPSDGLVITEQKATPSLTQNAPTESTLRREADRTNTMKPPPAASVNNTKQYSLPDWPIADQTATAGSNRRPVRFSALSKGGVLLDIHTYHRGREGVELRDEDTGELLCDVDPTDTNYGLDAPNLVAQVTIKFPLEDAPAAPNQEIRQYRETVSWDLADTATPTPMAFAAHTAENFGLSYTQTLELAESIQNQLRSFVRDKCSYAPAWALKDESGLIREVPQAFAHALYGDVTGLLEGGMSRPGSSRPRPSARVTVSIEKGAGKGTGKGAGKRKRDARSATEQKVEEIFIQEVQRRLLADSAGRIREAAGNDKLVGEITVHEGLECHICCESGRCGTFACSTTGHAYCESHLSERHGLSAKSDPVPLMLEYCPICALSCTCKRCQRRLLMAAQELKKKSLEQQSSPAETVFEGLLEHCCARELKIRNEDGTAAKKARPKKSKSVHEPVLRQVSKLPVSEFPVEVSDGIDKEPGTDIDYRTVYSASGSSILDSDAMRTVVASSHVANTHAVEDGSIDYCNVCRKCGNLLCCDFCPRAFHSSCIECDEQQDQSETTWECPTCIRERAGFPEDQIDGGKSLSLICGAFDDLQTQDLISKEDLKNLKVLSIIHEMLLRLMDYDFGYMFRQPVDLQKIPQYTNIVKRPMDLGTIASNLVNGSYKDQSGKREPLDKVISTALKDIELVWHNCFMFNLKGSAIYRMAEVQSRRAKSIQEKSFDSLLSDEVKRAVQDFKLSCEKERAVVADLGKVTQVSREENSSPHARRKITVAKNKCKKGRPVAVLDPDTGLIVKIYTTLRSAGTAVDVLLSFKFECEWDLQGLSIHKVLAKIREIVKESSKKPHYRLFGYRWLDLQRLRDGKVAFCDSVPEATKDRPSERKEVAAESGNAKVSIGDPGSRTKTDRRECPAAEVIEMAEGSKEGITSKGSDGLTLNPRLDSFLAPSSRQGADYDSPAGSVAFKEDLISGDRLNEFASLKSAYQDWVQSLKSSKFEQVELETLETFVSFYLDGDRNIDGVAWKRTTATREESGKISDSSRDKAKILEGVMLNGLEPYDVVAKSSSNGASRPTVEDGPVWSDLTESSRAVSLNHRGGNLMMADLVSPLVPRKQNWKSTAQTDAQLRQSTNSRFG